MTLLAIIQARVGSTRLPGKVLMPMPDGRPILCHVVERVRAVRNIDGIIVATTTNFEDHNVMQHCQDLNVACYRGHPTDVLSRFTLCAKANGADHILRVTADCAVWDWASGEAVVAAYRAGSYEYVSNVTTEDEVAKGISTDGWDAECFSFEALERAYNDWSSPYSREHVTPSIRLQPQKYRVSRVLPKTIPGAQKLSVDDHSDYLRVCEWWKRENRRAAA